MPKRRMAQIVRKRSRLDNVGVDRGFSELRVKSFSESSGDLSDLQRMDEPVVTVLPIRGAGDLGYSLKSAKVLGVEDPISINLGTGSMVARLG